MIFNSTQTTFGDELLKNLSSEYRCEFLEVLDAIPLVRELIRSDRKRAIDMPRDNKNRIIVDLEHPHILEDSDYFRQSAIHFENHGVYTKLFPNSAYGSEYRKFWEQEMDRCVNGYARDDGEWITGYHYFYLNYCRIDLVVKDDYGKDVRIENFPKFWDGDYWWFHYVEKCERDGGHGVCLKTRRRGFSYKAGAMACRNYHLLPKSKSYFVADTDEFLIKDGLINKAWQNTVFVNEHTEFKKLSDKIDRPKHKRASYVDSSDGLEKGYMSEMIGITTNDDPDKVRGKAGRLMLFEEAGKNKNLMYCYNIAKPSFEQGRRVFGTMLIFGTGGSDDSDFSGLWEFFTNPIPYGVIHFKNLYDKGNVNTLCGFFHPEYVNREDCFDKDGNSDVIKALIEIYEDRSKLRHVGDRNVLMSRRAEQPITPVEAVMKKEGNFFPVSDIREYMAPIIADEAKFVSGHHAVDLIIDGTGGISPQMSPIAPIRQFPIARDANKRGCVEIFEMPDHSVKFNYWRYIAGIDPIDDDYALYSDSLGSIFVFDRWKRRIVAEYTGRPQSANEFYEICHRLLRFYNALANYENNKKGLFAYFNQKNLLRFLSDTPRILRDNDMVKEKYAYGNKAKGYNANSQINDWARRLQLDWMMQSAYEDDGEDKGRINLHTIRSLGYLKELLMWNPDINADRISAMGACLILDADMARVDLAPTKEEDTDLYKSLKEFQGGFFKKQR